MPYARADLINEALANLGIVQQAPGAGTGTATTQQLVSRVLFDLGALSDNRDPSPGETRSVVNILPSVVANLSANGIVTITDTNAIPTQYFLPFAAVVTDALKDEYGVADTAELQRIITDSVTAQRNLKNLTRTYIIDRNLNAIYAELSSLDVIHLIDDSAIPDEWFTPLAWIVADRCKAKGFDLTADVIQRATDEGAKALMSLRERTRQRPTYMRLRSEFF